MLDSGLSNFDDTLQQNARIIVIGVGGGGSNAVNSMIHDKSDEVDYWVFNTDGQALSKSPCPNKLILGRNVTKGLGAGGIPKKGEEAALDSLDDIKTIVSNYDLCFLAVGEGGGTGTGAAPIVAQAAKDSGCLVLAIVTRPFDFEGRTRKMNALGGINALKDKVDSLIVVSNDKMMLSSGNLNLRQAFATSDAILTQSVTTVTDLILKHGMINLDFNDLKTTLTNKGITLIGIGVGQGENKAVEAANNAINSPLLEASIKGARSMIINVIVSETTSMDDVRYATNYIKEAAGIVESEVSVIFGVQIDESLDDMMKVAVIATDFDKDMILDPNATNTLGSTETVPSFSQTQPTSFNTVKEMSENRNNTSIPDYLKDFFQSSSATQNHYEADENNMTSNSPSSSSSINDFNQNYETNQFQNTNQLDDDDDVVIVPHK